jgi:hypothetical protein
MGQLRRRSLRLRAVAFGVLSVLASFLPANRATAHPVGDHYHQKWAPPWEVSWGFTDGFPDGAKRDRVVDAFASWNEENQPLQWIQSAADFPNFDPTVCPQPARRNGVHWKNVDLAYASVCFDAAGNILSAQIVADSSGTTWWTSVDPVPTTQYDLWSAVSQEIGHTTGFLYGGPVNNPGHWPDGNTTLCPDPYSSNYLQRHTMCEVLWPGTRVQRKPYTHDDHTFAAAYDYPSAPSTPTVTPIQIGG